MAKIRGIKPETWTDDRIVSVTPLARLLFIGMWNFACDNGHLDDSPIQLKMRILPADNCDVPKLLDELLSVGLVLRDGNYLFIPNLTEHQKPHKRWWKTCDKPGCNVPDGATSSPPNRRATVAQPLGNGSATADVDGDVDGEGDSEVTTTTSATANADRPDVTEILDYLDAAIQANGARPPKRGKTNINAARLLIDRDKRTVTQIKAAIDYATNDEFWRANILSMSKLREKYDTLRLQAQRQQKKHPNSGSPRPSRSQENAAVVAELQRIEQAQKEITQ